MSIHLPPPIDLYVKIENSGDVEALSECFASNATVRDEGHTYEGLACIKEWKIEHGAEGHALASSAGSDENVKVALRRNFEFKLPLAWLLAAPGAATAAERKAAASAATSKLRLRFSLWQERLPVDALPLEGWIELQVLSEGDLLYAVT